MQENETVDQTENEDSQALGTSEAPATGSRGTEESESVDSSTSAQSDEATKRLQQIEMERNQLRNKIAQYEKEKEEARLAELSESDRLKEQLAQLEADKQQREAQDLRNRFVEEYDDPVVREAAKKLIAANPLNFVWKETTTTEDEAKSEIFRQMDELKSALPKQETETDETGEVISANNRPDTGDGVIAQDMSAAEMRKHLPVAPPR